MLAREAAFNFMAESKHQMGGKTNAFRIDQAQVSATVPADIACGYEHDRPRKIESHFSDKREDQMLECSPSEATPDELIANLYPDCDLS